MSTEKNRIVIIVEGGLVRGIYAENATTDEVAIIDYDIEGAEERDLQVSEVGERAYVSIRDQLPIVPGFAWDLNKLFSDEVVE